MIAGTAILSVCLTPQLTFAQQDDDVIEEEVVEPKKAKDYWIYGDANVGIFQFETSEGNTTLVSDSTFNAFFRAGVKYKYFGVEGEFGTGLSEIDEDGASLAVNSQLAGFGILRYPGGDNWDAFFRAGYHSTDFDISAEIFDPATGQLVEVSDSITADGFAFGVGGSYFFTENFGVRVDITGYNAGDIIDASYIGGTIGGAVKF